MSTTGRGIRTISLKRVAAPAVVGTTAFAVSAGIVSLIATAPAMPEILGTAVLGTVAFNAVAASIGAVRMVVAKRHGKPHRIEDLVKSRRFVVLTVACATVGGAAAIALPWLWAPALVAKVGIYGAPIDVGIGAAITAVSAWTARGKKARPSAGVAKPVGQIAALMDGGLA